MKRHIRHLFLHNVCSLAGGQDNILLVALSRLAASVPDNVIRTLILIITKAADAVHILSVVHLWNAMD